MVQANASAPHHASPFFPPRGPEVNTPPAESRIGRGGRRLSLHNMNIFCYT
jgi:hypothetical protein